MNDIDWGNQHNSARADQHRTRDMIAVSALFVASLVLLTLPRSVAATTVMHMSFDELTRKADVIAIGQVTNIDFTAADDASWVYTYVTLDVIDLLKGETSEDTITLRMDGGRISEERVLIVAGMPTFELGEEVVVFVKGNEQRPCPLLGWGQGLLRIDKQRTADVPRLKTSSGRRILGTKNGEFVLEPDKRGRSGNKAQSGNVASLGVDSEGTASTYTVGRAAEEAQEAGAELTLDQLKQDISGILASQGRSIAPGGSVAGPAAAQLRARERAAKPPRNTEANEAQ